jgi:hypothetical protein
VYNRTITPLPRPLHNSEPFKIVKLLREAERFRQITATLSGLDKTLQVGAPKLLFVSLQSQQAIPSLLHPTIVLTALIGKNQS